MTISSGYQISTMAIFFYNNLYIYLGRILSPISYPKQPFGPFCLLLTSLVFMDVTLPPIIMVQSKMGVSPIGSLPFKYSHLLLPWWWEKSFMDVTPPSTKKTCRNKLPSSWPFRASARHLKCACEGAKIHKGTSVPKETKIDFRS